MHERFGLQKYMIRRKVFKLFGQAFHIYDGDGNVMFYSKLKAFKLREDVRLYTDESMTTELLAIKARQILDFGATYDVVDGETGENVGALRRKALKSFLRDEWIILDHQGREIGIIREDSMALALIRRFLLSIVPQSFSGTVDGQPVLVFHRHFNIFVLRMDLDFTPDFRNLLDRRMGIAAAVLLSAIEGRQD